MPPESKSTLRPAPRPKALRLAIVALVAGALAYLWFASTHTARFRVQVCVRYEGAAACRIADGKTRLEAQRAAHDNACAQITSGVTGTLGCQNTPATQVQYLN